jgi:crotonobetainyl-CoA:carnitine CoA-transferase CaiB-like acyl-CoA transferase
VERLNAKDIPSGAILDLGDALAQPQVRHRGTLREVAVDGIGTIPLFNLSARFEKTPGEITAPPPQLSADTAEVLAGIGVAREELGSLKAKGVI